ncbi:MAG: shikimate dehydrogenase [Chloroflexota bacterium]|nr:shikimate dehydrogenase [Chloroflexota bacterium]
MPIDGHTQLVGLVGWPVEHTMSPAMHNAAFAALELNWRYVPLPVPPERVEAAMPGLVALGFRGANVTVPHKQAVLPALDTVAPEAQILGAVNTVVIERAPDGSASCRGHNTDAAGFMGALRDGGFDPRGASAVVVGAGGAARAVVFSLREARATQIVVLNRTLEHAQRLVSDLGHQSSTILRVEPFDEDALVEAARAADLLVNATPMGMSPRANDSVWPDEVPLPAHLTVFDLVYNPLETRLLRQARRSGAGALDGLGMLVRQGALAFEMWTGEEAPVAVMRSACQQALIG